MSNLKLNRIQLGTDRVLMVPSPEDDTVELRKGTAEVPGDLIARFTGANLELGTTGQAIGSAAFLNAIGAAPLYGRDSVLGTVSQVGGVPTGGLMQYHVSASGEAWRYAGGMQICTRTYSAVVNVSTAIGSMFTSSEISLPFAFSFIDDPVTSVVVGRTVGDTFRLYAALAATSPTNFRFYAVSPATSASVGVYFHAIAVGRWY